jgi:hypothetical protein
MHLLCEKTYVDFMITLGVYGALGANRKRRRRRHWPAAELE